MNDDVSWADTCQDAMFAAITRKATDEEITSDDLFTLSCAYDKLIGVAAPEPEEKPIHSVGETQMVEQPADAGYGEDARRRNKRIGF